MKSFLFNWDLATQGRIPLFVIAIESEAISFVVKDRHVAKTPRDDRDVIILKNKQARRRGASQSHFEKNLVQYLTPIARKKVKISS